MLKESELVISSKYTHGDNPTVYTLLGVGADKLFCSFKSAYDNQYREATYSKEAALRNWRKASVKIKKKIFFYKLNGVDFTYTHGEASSCPIEDTHKAWKSLRNVSWISDIIEVEVEAPE